MKVKGETRIGEFENLEFAGMRCMVYGIGVSSMGYKD